MVTDHMSVDTQKFNIIPAATMDVDMRTPVTPNNMIGKKLWKNCFFFT